ncbi:hypothetical protein [Microbacterium aurantiacum]|uniref:hypothetical protein n=1 Tax=Microbacterium aurantiacum TaxID=162393 RepID=UPI000C80C685|nr:hypothetical protein [Microbacterium aurantiacum]
MARYENGRIPFDVLVHLGGEHYLTPGTAAKFIAMRADVWENEGVWLEISPGANGYRWFEKQEEAYRDEPDGNAAYPGSSSHGGEYNGRDAMAVDIGNWGRLGRALFYHYARKHGFEPDVFDWEPWHLIDWEPWAAAPATATPAPKPRRKRNTMTEAAYRTPGGTIAIQGRLGGALTLLDDPDEWTGIHQATGAATWGISEDKLNYLVGHYGTVPAGLYDTGREPLRILAPAEGGASRYGALGGRAWPLTNVRDLAALQRQAAEVVVMAQSEIDAALAWRNF